MSDSRYVHYLMRTIGREPTHAMLVNLKRTTTIPWLADCRRIIEQLDDAAQHSVVRFVMASGVPRQQAMTVIETVLLYGKAGGRREAARALGDFQGTQANTLAMRALADPDPQVQANIVPQLRGRGIPGVLPNLLELVESPYAAVRNGKAGEPLGVLRSLTSWPPSKCSMRMSAAVRACSSRRLIRRASCCSTTN